LFQDKLTFLFLLKQFHSKGLNYGFIDYDDPGAAERAMATLNGRKIHGNVRFVSQYPQTLKNLIKFLE
jgi:hypothetical protein